MISVFMQFLSWEWMQQRQMRWREGDAEILTSGYCSGKEQCSCFSSARPVYPPQESNKSPPMCPIVREVWQATQLHTPSNNGHTQEGNLTWSSFLLRCYLIFLHSHTWCISTSSHVYILAYTNMYKDNCPLPLNTHTHTHVLTHWLADSL